MINSDQVLRAYHNFLPGSGTLHRFDSDDSIDVVEFELADGTFVFGTVGASFEAKYPVTEFVMRSKTSEPDLINLLAKVGGKNLKLTHGDILSMSSSEFPNVGFFWTNSVIKIDVTSPPIQIALMQALPLRAAEAPIAIRESLETLEGFWWQAGRDGRCFDRSSTSIVDKGPLFLESDLAEMSHVAREMIWKATLCDFDYAEKIRFLSLIHI